MECGTLVNLEMSIKEATNHCIENRILEEFLRENRNEVAQVMVLDYTRVTITLERREELIRAEEYEEGERAGRAEGERIGRAEGERIGRAEGERARDRELILQWYL